jgi:hypothetical protein
MLLCDGGMHRPPDTAIYLDRVKSNESPSGVATYFRKWDHRRMRPLIALRIQSPVSQSIKIAFFNTSGSKV